MLQTYSVYTVCLRTIGGQWSKFLYILREAAKKFFFSSPTTKALPPPLFEHSGHPFLSEFIFFELQKSYFFIVVRPLPPSLSGPATKKELFCGFPIASNEN